jgi:hypothetical protein
MLKAGQVLYDNDQRYRGRKVEVVLDYIFSDGKPRRSGYSTVPELGLSSSTGAQPQ